MPSLELHSVIWECVRQQFALVCVVVSDRGGMTHHSEQTHIHTHADNVHIHVLFIRFRTASEGHFVYCKNGYWLSVSET